jgi:hypothetical protein
MDLVITTCWDFDSWNLNVKLVFLRNTFLNKNRKSFASLNILLELISGSNLQRYTAPSSCRNKYVFIKQENVRLT